MLFLSLLLLSILLVIVFYLIGKSMMHIFKLQYAGFEHIVGYLGVFGVFHLLSIFPTIMHFPVSWVYYGVFPLLFIGITSVLVIGKPKFSKPRLGLMISVIVIAGFYLMFDYIRYGDASFYLSLIRSTVDAKALYIFNPWSNEYSGNPGFMYYFVTYEVFIGTLSRLFLVDSTVFAVNVIAIVHLSIIIYTTHAFFTRLMTSTSQVNKASSLYLFNPW